MLNIKNGVFFYVIIGERHFYYRNSFATSTLSVSVHDEISAVKSVAASFIPKAELSGAATEV